MRIEAQLDVRLAEVGPTTFRDLVAIFPTGISRPDATIFSATLDADSPPLKRILERLEAAGFRPWSNTLRRRDRSSEFSFQLRRYYDDSDLGAATLLEPGFTFTHPPTPCEGTDEQGRLILDRHPSRAISYAISSCFTIITDPVRKAIEKGGFAGEAIFLPTVNRERPGATVWQLRSRNTMPPVSPTMILALEDGSPFEGRYEQRCVRLEELFHARAELHYRAVDVRAMGPFDLAHTKERFGEGATDEFRPLVISRRLYEMCKDHGFEGGFTPVRLDP